MRDSLNALAAIASIIVLSGGLYLLLRPGYIEGSPVSKVMADVRTVAIAAEMYARDLKRVPESTESLYRRGYLAGEPQALSHVLLFPQSTGSIIVKYDGPGIGSVTADHITSVSCRQVRILPNGTVVQAPAP